MKVDILTREYPPKVYGGAGVHAAVRQSLRHGPAAVPPPFDKGG